MRFVASGTMGLVVGFAAGLLDGLLSTRFGQNGPVMLEIAQSLLILVPLGWIGGLGVGAMFIVLGKLHRGAERAMLFLMPQVWILGVFSFLAVAWYHGIGSHYFAYVRCGFWSLVVGVPSYLVLRRLWVWFDRDRGLVMVGVATVVGLGVLMSMFKAMAQH
jgi:hypothetical protein